MRNNTVQYALLRAMFFLTACWESDLKLIVRGKWSEASVTKGLKRLTEDGLVTVEKLDGMKKSGMYKTVFITGKGRRALADSGEDYFYDEYRYKNYERRFNGYRTTTDDRMFRRLTGNKVRAMFTSADVRTFPIDKPTLYRIFFKSLPKSDARWNNYDQSYEHDTFYKDMTDDEIDACLKDTEGGFYYTSDEYREMLDQIAPNTSDTIKGSRFRGIYFNKYTCLAVYSQEPGKKGMIGIAPDTEKKLKDSIENFITACLPDVHRMISGVKLPPHESNALIISNGYAMVYNMVTGFRNGILKVTANGKDFVETAKNVRRFMYGDPRFPRLFVTPATLEGAESLFYLTHNSAERWILDTRNKITELHRSNPTDLEDGIFDILPPHQIYSAFTGICQKMVNGESIAAYVLYLPVCEINILRQISANGSDANKEIVIITNPSISKIDVIDHSIRRPAIYFDEESGKELYYDIDNKRLVITTGKTYNAMLLTTRLNAETGYGYTYTDSELNTVASCLANGDSEEEIIDELETLHDFSELLHQTEERRSIPVPIQSYGYNGKPIDDIEGNNPIVVQGRKEKPPISTVCIYIAPDRLKEIKRAANSQDKSLSRFCADILYEQAGIINSEAKELREEIKKKIRDFQK